MSCPWAKIEKSEPIKFEEIISEEVARKLHIKEEKKGAEEVADEISTTEINDFPFQRITGDDSGSDAILQIINKVYDDGFESEEENCSGSCIDDDFRLSFNYDFENDSEEEEIYFQDGGDWDKFDPCVSENVFKRNKKIENVENVTVGGGKNACKLSSKVFNSLELPSYEEEFRRYKVHRDKQKRPTPKLLGIDPHAWRLIRDIIKDQILHKVVDVFSFGREAVTLRAVQFCPRPVRPKWCKKMRVPPQWCMVKVFKMNLKLGNARVTACQKAEKEAANYKRLKAAGVPCLDLITQKEHVLVTSYFEECSKNLRFGYNYEYVYDKVKMLMKKLYEANFIHPNLTERDIVWTWYIANIINISCLVERSHKDAFDYLFRGCTNIVNFFKQKGVPHMEEPDGLFKYITGYSFLDKQSLSKLKKSVQPKITLNGNGSKHFHIII